MQLRLAPSPALPIASKLFWPTLSADFDLILMDVQMSEMDGFEVSAEICKHEQPLSSPSPRTPEKQMVTVASPPA